MRLASIVLMIAISEPDDGCLAAFEAVPPADPHRRAAHTLWIRECADCHGVRGDVDGLLSGGLEPAPPNFRDPCRPLTDEWIARAIVDGGEGFDGSPEMRAHHELDDDPRTVVALVELVQGFRGADSCEQRPQLDPRGAVAPDGTDSMDLEESLRR